MRRTFATVMVATVLAIPAAANAQDLGDPPSTANPARPDTPTDTTTAAPPPSSGPRAESASVEPEVVRAQAGAGAETATGAETQTSVGTEAQFRQALTDLSVNPSGPHEIALTQNIVLDDGTDPTYSGDQPLTIEGNGFSIDAMDSSRVLTDDGTSPTLTLRNVTITQGLADGSGGGILWGGPVHIEDSTLTDNHVSGSTFQSGGAVSGKPITVIDSAFTDNSVTSTGSNAVGGAISVSLVGASFTADGMVATGNTASTTSATSGAVGGAVQALGSVQIDNSILSDNEAVGDFFGVGGALSAKSSTVIRTSLLTSNRASHTGAGSLAVAEGGALRAESSATIIDTTLAHNHLDSTDTDSRGSAAQVDLVLTMTNTTVAANRVTDNGDGALEALTISLDQVTISANGDSGAALVALSLTSTGSVIGPQSGATDCDVGGVASTGPNVESAKSCKFDDVGDQQNVADIGLGPLRDNGDEIAASEVAGTGQPRPTMFPLADSPLIDVFPPGACSQADDERGVGVPFGSGCDIGAIESVFPAHGFSDVTPFYEGTVRWITSTVNTPQILLGFADNTFGQTLNITRGQAARLYYRAAGAPDTTGLDPHGLTDVTPFCENAVKWAKHHGLADGFADLTYRQTNNINRGNASRTAYNLAQTNPAWADTMTAPTNMLFKSNLP